MIQINDLTRIAENKAKADAAEKLRLAEEHYN